MTSSTGNIFPVTGPLCGEFTGHRSFDVLFDRHLNKRMCKQSWSWWFQTPSRSLWRHCNGKPDINIFVFYMNFWSHNIGNWTSKSLTDACRKYILFLFFSYNYLLTGRRQTVLICNTLQCHYIPFPYLHDTHNRCITGSRVDKIRGVFYYNDDPGPLLLNSINFYPAKARCCV